MFCVKIKRVLGIPCPRWGRVSVGAVLSRVLSEPATRPGDSSLLKVL